MSKHEYDRLKEVGMLFEFYPKCTGDWEKDKDLFPKPGSLCYRCEHRAKFLEGGPRPRYECGEVNTSKYTCYMYKPVKPVVLEKLNKEDKRPENAGIFGSRMQFKQIADVEIKAKYLGTSSILYWVPNEDS